MYPSTIDLDEDDDDDPFVLTLYPMLPSTMTQTPITVYTLLLLTGGKPHDEVIATHTHTEKKTDRSRDWFGQRCMMAVMMLLYQSLWCKQ